MKRIEHRIIDAEEQKWCNGCQTYHKLTEFYKASNMWDGLQSKCKSFVSANTYKKYNASDKAKGTGKRYRVSDGGIQWRADYVASERGAFAVLRATHKYRHNTKGQDMYKQRDIAYRENKRQGDFTLSDWKEVCIYFNNSCAYCGQIKPLTQDHVYPMNLGGTYTVDNILPVCKSCNSSKQDTEPGIWFAERVSDNRMDRIIKYFEEEI